ncbi:MAG: hypothetical protein JST12_18120 [Armatimonadetes bacterium]|nr:hypothetical protein [Armatimonadota bacterium]
MSETIVLNFQETGLATIAQRINETTQKVLSLTMAITSLSRAMHMVGQAAVDSKITKIGTAAKNAAANVSTLNTQLSHLTNTTKKLPSNLASQVQGHGQSGASGSGYTAPSGPYSAYFDAVRQFHSALTHGSPVNIADAQFNLHKAYGAAKSASKSMSFSQSDTGKMISKAASSFTSQLGPASGIADEMLPMLLDAGPVGWAALAAVGAGVGAFNSSKNISKSTGFNFVNGSGSFARTSGMYEALGIDNALGSSNQFNSSIEKGPGAYFARQAGVNPYYNSFSGAGGDFAEKQRKFLAYYGDSSKSSDQQAAAAARATGMEDQVGLIRTASASVRKMALETTGDGYTKSERQNASDTKLLWGMLGGEFSKTVSKLFTSITPVLNALMKWLIHAMQFWQKIIDWINQTAGMMKVFATVIEWVSNIVEKVAKWLPGTGAQDNKEAAKEMKSAAQGIKQAVDKFMDGVYGHNANQARGLIPNGLHGAAQNADQAAAHYYASRGIPITA